MPPDRPRIEGGRRPLDSHSHLLFQSRPPTSKHFETPDWFWEILFDYPGTLKFLVIACSFMHLSSAIPWGGTPGKCNFIWGLLGGFERSFHPACGGNGGGLVSVSLAPGENRGLRKRNRSISSCLTSIIIEKPPYRRMRAHNLLVDEKNDGRRKLGYCCVNPFPSCYSLYLLLEI